MRTASCARQSAAYGVRVDARSKSDLEAVSLDAMLDDLRTLVEIESPSLDVEALEASAPVLADMIERHLGRPAELIPSPVGPHVHWTGGGEPRVLLLGHHDTVFPIGALADRPFDVSDGRATGPGACMDRPS